MLLDNYTKFLDKIFEQIKQRGIDVSSFLMDHLAYQASTDADYDKLKEEIKQISQQISERIVNDRPVGIFKLNQPLQYQSRVIEVIELVAPVTGKTPDSALEHVEFVINEDFKDFMRKYPHITDWDTASIDRPDFPHLKLHLSPNTQIKFHYQDILEMVGEA